MKNELINKILFILGHMSSDLRKIFKSKVNYFSNEEIKNIYDFLITGDINIILLFIKNKNKEFKDLINIIKQEKGLRKIKLIKLEEKLDNKNEKNDIEKLIVNI